MPSGASSKDNRSCAVIAAGAVVLRTSDRQGRREVLLIHRPKYDDWSFPKGKLDPGEHVTTAATREVLEETGIEVRLGRPLPRQVYAMASGREKNVHYWVGHVVGSDDASARAADAEVDEVRWVRVDDAARTLSRPDDVLLLEAALEEPRRTRTLVVLRHGRAMGRSHWGGADDERPLTDVGRRQAASLVPVLRSLGVGRVVTSPAARCVRTVTPYADAQAIGLERWPGLSEGGYDGVALEALASDLLASSEPVVACTHRPVLPWLLGALGVDEEPLATGEIVVVHHRTGRVVDVERHLVG